MTARPVLTLKRPKRGTKHPVVKRPVLKKNRVAKHPAAKGKVEAPPPPRVVSDAEFLAELRNVAPDLWDPDNPTPLAVGIHKQLYPIAERMEVSRRSLRRFLSRWTSSRPYQRALSEPGACRFNLDGSPAGEVSQQHGETARQRTTPG